MATTFFACPKGDQSEDPEFCSVCGIKMEGAPSALSSAAVAPAATSSAERCPSCGVDRKPGARFCETCRYDFKAAAPGPPPDPDPVVTVATPTPPDSTQTRYWEAVVAVDPTLDVEPDPTTPCPTDTPERTFPLDLPENLIGRRASARGIFPQIALDDPGVSHRHLMIYRNADAGLLVSDLGSTNGTFLNGNADRLEPGVKTPLADGDRVELGRWTRITVRQHT
jgi:hypothetical protein